MISSAAPLREGPGKTPPGSQRRAPGLPAGAAPAAALRSGRAAAATQTAPGKRPALWYQCSLSHCGPQGLRSRAQVHAKLRQEVFILGCKMVGSHNGIAWLYPWLGHAGYRYYTVKARLLQKVKTKLLNLSIKLGSRKWVLSTSH